MSGSASQRFFGLGKFQGQRSMRFHNMCGTRAPTFPEVEEASCTAHFYLRLSASKGANFLGSLLETIAQLVDMITSFDRM